MDSVRQSVHGSNIHYVNTVERIRLHTRPFLHGVPKIQARSATAELVVCDCSVELMTQTFPADETIVVKTFYVIISLKFLKRFITFRRASASHSHAEHDTALVFLSVRPSVTR